MRVAGVEIWLSERDRTWDRALEMVCTSVADWDGVKDERARVDGYRGRDWRVMAMIHRCCSTTDGGYAERSGLVGALATTERNNSLENPSVPAKFTNDGRSNETGQISSLLWCPEVAQGLPTVQEKKQGENAQADRRDSDGRS